MKFAVHCLTLSVVLISTAAFSQQLPDAPKPHSPLSTVATMGERYSPLIAGWSVGYIGFRSGSHACLVEDIRNGVGAKFGTSKAYGGTLTPNRDYLIRTIPALAGTVLLSELLRLWHKPHSANRVIDWSGGIQAGLGFGQIRNCS